MKKIISIIFVFIYFFMPTQYISAIEIEVDQERTENGLLTEEINMKTANYLKEYLEKSMAMNQEVEEIFPQDYLIDKLVNEGFSEEEVLDALQKIKEDRKAFIINTAQNYLKKDPYLSRESLIAKLLVKPFIKDEVKLAVDSLDTDWKVRAIKSAEKYINLKNKEEETIQILSKKSLNQYLIEEKGFKPEDAATGIKKSRINWKEQAVKQAEFYLAGDSLSKKTLINMLVLEGFNFKEIDYTLARIEVDWEGQAIIKAKQYLESELPHSEKDLANYLKNNEFTVDEIVYAIAQFFPKEIIEEDKQIKEKNISIVLKPIRLAEESPPKAYQDEMNLKKIQTENQETDSARLIKNVGIEKKEAAEEELKPEEKTEATSLLDNPIFTPIILVLIVGNIYLFQKM